MTIIKKRKYYNKTKTFITQIYINIYIIKKKLTNHFYKKKVKEEKESKKEMEVLL